MNIWQSFNKPIFVLAPMEDVTDTVFRQVVARAGAPDIFFTEFTNVEGLCSPGRDRVAHRLHRTPVEQPLVAQIWGRTPEKFYKVAQELSEAGFAGIDLNMGCPDRTVVRRGECSGLIHNPSLAAEMIAATKEGAGDLPVSVKTRCGLSHWMTEEWVEFLLGQDIAALTLHGRIAKEMSKFPARWDEISKAVNIRDRIAPQTKLIGNGDVISYHDGLQKCQQFGVDGVMVGRGIFQNPWFFDPDVNYTDVSLQDRLALLHFHVELFAQTWSTRKNYNLLKKFYKIYLLGLPDVTELKDALMATTSTDECLAVIAKQALEVRLP